VGQTCVCDAMLVMRDFREVGLAVMGGHGGASRGPVPRRTPMCWKKARHLAAKTGRNHIRSLRDMFEGEIDSPPLRTRHHVKEYGQGCNLS
jgi:hypothetical protein